MRVVAWRVAFQAGYPRHKTLKKKRWLSLKLDYSLFVKYSLTFVFTYMIVNQISSTKDPVVNFFGLVIVSVVEFFVFLIVDFFIENFWNK